MTTQQASPKSCEKCGAVLERSHIDPSKVVSCPCLDTLSRVALTEGK